MKLIKELSEQIEEELDGAEWYAKKALKCRDEHPTLAKTFYDIATDEMRHAELLHGEVLRLIDSYRKQHGDPPAAMLAVYDYMHEKQIEEANEVRGYLSQYRSA